MAGLTGALQSACVIALVLSCAAPSQTPTPGPSHTRGGTLRIAFADDPEYVRDLVYADPGRQNPGLFMRCCLGRTLLTYPGESTIDGGTTLVPDLAQSLPELSRDGLSWTFKLRPGIKYAPPNDTLEVTSADFVTAVERSIRINGGEAFPPFLIVEGVQEYADGSASSVSGLQTPDPQTLVIRLTEPFGALDYLADPIWAPIPESVALGHDEDLGGYWPSTGPYMYETYPGGSTDTEFAFVRNPSWARDTDPRREAYVDRIELSIADGDLASAWERVNSSEFDFAVGRLDGEAARRYRSDPSSVARLRSTPDEYLYRLPMNIAMPPFDDVAVRRAVALAVDRVDVRDAILASFAVEGRPPPATVLSEHMFGDAVTDGLLVGYDPFQLGDGRGDISRARTAMARSAYDSDADGTCDADACSDIQLVTFDTVAGEAVARSLAPLGLSVHLVADDGSNGIEWPTNQVPIAVLPYGWGFELSGSEMSILVKGPVTSADAQEGESVVNASLVGARPEDLQRWGYSVTSVPSVDDVIGRCQLEVGSRRARCWAELDQLLAETVVPWVPLFGLESVWLASARVEQFTLDQGVFHAFPALDKVSLVPGSL